MTKNYLTKGLSSGCITGVVLAFIVQGIQDTRAVTQTLQGILVHWAVCIALCTVIGEYAGYKLARDEEDTK